MKNKLITNNRQFTTKAKPLVSVIMPVYNAGPFLVEAIESILHQTYKNFELIIVDDASTDNSREIIRDYKRTHPKKIKFLSTRKQTNAAGNGAMNYGLKRAKGVFIARMDADDIAHPKRLEKQVAYMKLNPQTILVGTQAQVIDTQGTIIGTKKLPLTHEGIYRRYGIFHPIIHPSVMIRRSLLPNPDRIYEMKHGVNDDYYTFFKLLQHGTFANLPEYYHKYRVHGTNSSLINPKQKFFDSVRIRIDAVRHLNYQMSINAYILMALQYVLISLIPERFIVPLYMIIRGINKPSAFSLRLPFLRISQKYATLKS